MELSECNTIDDFLQICGVKSVDELSDSQVLDWASSGKMGLETEISVGIVVHGMNGRKPDITKAMKLLKRAIKENKTFTCAYVMHESCNGRREIPCEYFGMNLKKMCNRNEYQGICPGFKG